MIYPKGPLLEAQALKVWDCVEVFSGKAVLSDCLRLAGMTAASLDIAYWGDVVEKRAYMGKPLKCRNALDLTHPAGFGLLAVSSTGSAAVLRNSSMRVGYKMMWVGKGQIFVVQFGESLRFW